MSSGGRRGALVCLGGGDGLGAGSAGNRRQFGGVCFCRLAYVDCRAAGVRRGGKGRERGEHQGLGWIPGEVVKLDPGDPRLKVPHMGWNQVQQVNDHPLWAGIDDNSRFYFVHSYCATGLPEEELAGRCEYGLTFAAAVAKHNVFAVQFHPEKSADAGLRLLANFLRWQP